MTPAADEIHYSAFIERTGKMDAPFVVIISLDGKEVARKGTKTSEEAQLFLEMLQAVLERKIAQFDGPKLH